MTRNHETTTSQPLLDAQGVLIEPGWSRHQLQTYDRAQIKAPKFRIKEWDYYIVLSQEFGVALTISDDGYIGLQSATLLDFTKPREHTATILTPLPMGRLRLPANSGPGETLFQNKRVTMRFSVTPGQRHLTCDFANFLGNKPFSCDITLAQPDTETMVIATPWAGSQTAFYYNQKINCMPASGVARFDGREYVFDPDTCFGTLDWGRGVWTYDNTWKWASGSSLINGYPFGFNLGYGFGDTTAATENILFYDRRAHKLDDVEFHIPADSYTEPWQFSSSDGRFEADFTPIIDRAAKINAGVIMTDQHQVFGRMTGQAVLDDGTKLAIRDMLCFAEDVHMRY